MSKKKILCIIFYGRCAALEFFYVVQKMVDRVRLIVCVVDGDPVGSEKNGHE